MKKHLFLIISWFAILSGFSQNQTITLTFSGEDTVTHNVLPLESIYIRNATLDCDTTIFGGSPAFLLTVSMGIHEQDPDGSAPLMIMPPVPNPFSGKTIVTIRLNQSGILHLTLLDAKGRIISAYQDDLHTGLFRFEIESSLNEILLLNASIGSVSKSVKLISHNDGIGENRITFLGHDPNNLKSGSAVTGFRFRPGDQLSFKSIRSGYYDKTIIDSPVKDTAYKFVLVMIPAAPAVVTSEISVNGPTTASGGGEVVSDGGKPVTARGFCWSTALNPTLADPHTIDGTGTGTFLSSITGLGFSTTYHGRAYAINSVDTAYGEDATFTTGWVPDGFYVTGAVTAYHDLNLNARMTITRNEVNQTMDPDLFELYIPVMAGSDGFNIREVSGSTIKTYGADTDFVTVYNGTYDEPKVPFQRGSFREDTSRFTVPADGMYHVVIYLNTKKAVVVPVHWGMIGSATPQGWAISTAMNESAFNLTSMTWNIDSLVMRTGEWKFRYSDGWKVEIDTTVNIGGSMKGIKVNANFGGAVNDLVPGGANIINYIRGIYTCTIQSTPGTGSPYVADLIKTGELPPTDWTGVVCDAVGTGISLNNPNAIPDPSSWHWGNQLVGDNGGIPTKAGEIYTWTWTNIILEAWAGFKVRTLNALPPPVNGAYFDAGYEKLNIGASAPEIINNGGNLMATVYGSYTITLHIDAANSDEKEIIIVKN